MRAAAGLARRPDIWEGAAAGPEGPAAAAEAAPVLGGRSSEGEEEAGPGASQGCAHVERRLRGADLVPEGVEVGAVRVSVAGWEGWVLEGLQVRARPCAAFSPSSHAPTHMEDVYYADCSAGS
jgi:hypothetical protein